MRCRFGVASALAAAVLAVSGCGVQSTTINTFSASVAAPTSNPSSDATTVKPGRYTFWVYLLQPGNALVPVPRTSDVPPTLQSVVDSLVQQPIDASYSNALIKVPKIVITADPDFRQQYTVSTLIAYDALPAQAHWQLICTVWQFAQQNRPANATYKYSVRLKAPAGQPGDSGWHDCTDYTTNVPTGTTIPTTATTSAFGSAAGVPNPSSAATLPGFTAGNPSGTPGG